jgi:hypothetical protein
MQKLSDSLHAANTPTHDSGDTPHSTTNRPGQWVAAFSACIYAAYVLTVSAFLLFCNSLTSFVIYSAIPEFNDRIFMAALSQLFFFLMPIFLTFLQWYLFDNLRRLLSR